MAESETSRKRQDKMSVLPWLQTRIPTFLSSSEVIQEELWLIPLCWTVLKFHVDGRSSFYHVGGPLRRRTPWCKQGLSQVERTPRKGGRCLLDSPWTLRGNEPDEEYQDSSKLRKVQNKKQVENNSGRNLLNQLKKTTR